VQQDFWVHKVELAAGVQRGRVMNAEINILVTLGGSLNVSRSMVLK